MSDCYTRTIKGSTKTFLLAYIMFGEYRSVTSAICVISPPQQGKGQVRVANGLKGAWATPLKSDRVMGGVFSPKFGDRIVRRSSSLRKVDGTDQTEHLFESTALLHCILLNKVEDIFQEMASVRSSVRVVRGSRSTTTIQQLRRLHITGSTATLPRLVAAEPPVRPTVEASVPTS